jgi:tetratricopeptide (TPR) repeat protein
MRLKIAFIFFFVSCGMPGYSANPEAFESKIDTTGFGKSIDLILRRAHKLRLVNMDSALLTCDSAVAKIEILKDERRRAIFLATKGGILMNNGREVESIGFLKAAWNIAIALDRTRLQQIITNMLFCNYLYMGDYDVALEYGLKLLETATHAKDEEHIIIANFNLGLLYYKLYDQRRALKYYNTALKTTKAPIPDMYINIGLCYSLAEQYDSAFLNFKQAMHIAGADPADHILTNYHYGVAMALKRIRNYDSAFYHCYQGIAVAERRGDFRFLAEYHNALGEVFIETSQYSKALYYLRAGEKLCNENSLHAILQDTYLNFADLYSRKNEHVSASFYKEKYLQERQLVLGEDVLNRIALIETEYAERENLRKVVAGKKIMQWTTERIAIRESIIWLVIGGSILLIVLLVALIRIARITRSVNVQLEAEVKVETANVEDSLLSAIQERNAWNKSVLEVISEIRKLVASAKGYQNVLMNTDGAVVAGSGTDFSGELRRLEENLRVFQKTDFFNKRKEWGLSEFHTKEELNTPF